MNDKPQPPEINTMLDPLDADICTTCKMLVFAGEYHPYTACILFWQLGQADKVRSCLDAVRDYERRQLAMQDVVDETDLGNAARNYDELSLLVALRKRLSELSLDEGYSGHYQNGFIMCRSQALAIIDSRMGAKWSPTTSVDSAPELMLTELTSDNLNRFPMTPFEVYQEEDRQRLRRALRPFAAMDREGCDLSEVACSRGTASDLTIITSEDFRNAALAIDQADSGPQLNNVPCRALNEILVLARELVKNNQYSVRDAIYAAAVNGESDGIAMKALQDAGMTSPIMTIEDALSVFDRAIQATASASALSTTVPDKSSVPYLPESTVCDSCKVGDHNACEAACIDGFCCCADVPESLSSSLPVEECVDGEPMMHGPKPYRWCATHNDLMLRCDALYRPPVKGRSRWCPPMASLPLLCLNLMTTRYT